MPSPRTLFSNVADEVWLWVNTEGRRTKPGLGDYLPGVPDEALQSDITCSTGETGIQLAFQQYQIFKQMYKDHAGELSGSSKVLDFGCGWGRLIRFFLKDVEPSNLWGVDPHGGAIAACKETNKWCNFQLNDPFPPSSFPSAEFDLIYSYSVFSHLSEETHNRWLVEFNRILKPGGILIATTLNRAFIEWSAQTRKKENLDSEAKRPDVATAFEDTDHWLSAYDSGEFCFGLLPDSGYNRGQEHPFFGQACIPEAYVRKHWTEHFSFLDYNRDLDPGSQNVIIVKK
jgi:SAM-dependent methyltransferase